MKSELVRFGVAMEAKLLEQFDVLVESRGSTRSEALRDLVRAEIVRSHVARGVDSFASLTLVYNESQSLDVRERLHLLRTECDVRCTTRLELTGGYCMEVLILRGPSDTLKSQADRLLATRGVKHGGVEIIADITKHQKHT
jgi:CopG family transcriptional regulator, nickel-responsive regulator